LIGSFVLLHYCVLPHTRFLNTKVQIRKNWHFIINKKWCFYLSDQKTYIPFLIHRFLEILLIQRLFWAFWCKWLQCITIHRTDSLLFKRENFITSRLNFVVSNYFCFLNKNVRSSLRLVCHFAFLSLWQKFSWFEMIFLEKIIRLRFFQYFWRRRK